MKCVNVSSKSDKDNVTKELSSTKKLPESV